MKWTTADVKKWIAAGVSPEQCKQSAGQELFNQVLREVEQEQSTSKPEQAPAEQPQQVQGSAATEPTAFENRALPLIARRIPVVPIPARTKIANLKNWQHVASTDAAQIAAWSKQEPDANVASVAKAQPGGVWFFELDRKDLLQQIEQHTGEKFPETFMVRSSPGRGHLYFKQTAASIAMGNRQAKDEHGELWSARVDDRYVIGPGSVHPSGSVYEVLKDVEIVEAPQWLIDYCSATKPKTGQTELDSEEPIIEGSRNNALTSIAGKARQVLKMDREQLYTYLLDVNQKRCRPPLPDSEVRTISDSISGYAVKPVGKIEFGSTQVPVQETRPLETESINPNELSSEPMDYLPSTVLASTRLQDIYLEHFQDYGWPLTMALPALVTAASVVVPFQPRGDNLVFGDDVMTNLYTALIGGVGVGKTQVINWGASAIGIYEPPVGQHYFEVKSGSAEQMLKSLHKKQSVFTSKAVLINPDEWSHFFKKAHIPDASFPTVLTTSFYRRHQIITVGGTGGGTEYPLNLAMSFIGGIVEEEFDEVFGATSLGGLYDRFLFGKAPDGFKWNYSPCPIPAKKHWAEWNLRPVQIDGSVYEVVKDWNRESPGGLGRVAEICVRIADIYACLDGRSTITGKDMEPLKPLAQYEAGLRQVYRPNPGQNPDAVFANKALGWIQKHAHEWTSIARLKQHTWRIEQNLGPAVAVRSLVGLARSGRIELWLRDGSTNTMTLPSDYHGPIPKIGLVRRVK